jgi:2-polyprenyl-3-methyl-5-hydroxy-6-metoxy-1,4-benzoquinol methylase
MSQTHFDQAAATWDANPTRLAMSNAVAAAIQAAVPLRAAWTAMEYGCGTATLSFLLAGKLGHITAADASTGMLDQVLHKATANGIANVQPCLLDLTHALPPAETFDFIFCAMALHHVTDTADLAAKFAALLLPGGWLAVADLHAEDGSFHQDMVVPHNGFVPEDLAAVFANAGLTGLTWRTVHELERQGRKYPLFLLTGMVTPRPGLRRD